MSERPAIASENGEEVLLESAPSCCICFESFPCPHGLDDHEQNEPGLFCDGDEQHFVCTTDLNQVSYKSF
jgi:hypothetical protein